MFAQEYGILRATATREQRVDPVAFPIHLFQNVAGAVSDGLNRGKVVQREIISGRRERQPGRRAFQGRVGARRTIAVEVGLDMDIACEFTGRFRAVRLREGVESLVEELVDRASLFLGFGLKWFRGGMRKDHVLD